MTPEQDEIRQARRAIEEAGRDSAGFSFTVDYLPPDPDGGGMFTQYYNVAVRHDASGKVLDLIGGIGTGWLQQLKEEVGAGYFD